MLFFIEKIQILITLHYNRFYDQKKAILATLLAISILSVNMLVTVQAVIITVDVDIKPGSYPNSFNINKKGVMPIVILTSDTFDATTVDPVTVTVLGVNPLRWWEEDVDGDGDLDLGLHFEAQEIVATLGSVNDGDDVDLTVEGLTFGGTSFSGVDNVIIRKKGK
jgi:hypothetical protein